jgi:transcriptional regulator
MRMAKEAVDRAVKIQMERIQMYKDLNEMMNSSDTNKNLKKKLETYLSGENSKVSFKLL